MDGKTDRRTEGDAQPQEHNTCMSTGWLKNDLNPLTQGNILHATEQEIHFHSAQPLDKLTRPVLWSVSIKVMRPACV